MTLENTYQKTMTLENTYQNNLLFKQKVHWDITKCQKKKLRNWNNKRLWAISFLFIIIFTHHLGMWSDQSVFADNPSVNIRSLIVARCLSAQLVDKDAAPDPNWRRIILVAPNQVMAKAQLFARQEHQLSPRKD